jgi:hypothetical protein
MSVAGSAISLRSLAGWCRSHPPCAPPLVPAYAAFGSYRGRNTRAWPAATCLNVARSEVRRRRPWELPSRALLAALPLPHAAGRRPRMWPMG